MTPPSSNQRIIIRRKPSDQNLIDRKSNLCSQNNSSSQTAMCKYLVTHFLVCDCWLKEPDYCPAAKGPQHPLTGLGPCPGWKDRKRDDGTLEAEKKCWCCRREAMLGPDEQMRQKLEVNVKKQSKTSGDVERNEGRRA